MCKIIGDNAAYFFENNKKYTGGLGVLLSIKMSNLEVVVLVNLQILRKIHLRSKDIFL